MPFEWGWCRSSRIGWKYYRGHEPVPMGKALSRAVSVTDGGLNCEFARYRRKDEASEEFWEEIHEVFANLTPLLVGLHVAGVLFSGYAHRENLIESTFTGRKPSEL